MEKHDIEALPSDYHDSITSLLHEEQIVEPEHSRRRSWWRAISVLEFLALLACLSYFWLSSSPQRTLWSPAQDLQSYELKTSTPYFFNRSPYLGTDTERVDKLWEDLYDAGMISSISGEEASHLFNETRAAPKAPDLYLVQLQVFHDLHCLNLIRKWVYMDVYSDQAVWKEGLIDHDALNAIHVDHCIDNLRQSLMCTNDITPRKFAPHTNERQYYVYPEIYTTQMCGNFEAINAWSKERRVVEWMMSFDDDWKATRWNVSMPDPED